MGNNEYMMVFMEVMCYCSEQEPEDEEEEEGKQVRIKRLELTGFKSSKDRTVLEFPEGITGIGTQRWSAMGRMAATKMQK